MPPQSLSTIEFPRVYHTGELVYFSHTTPPTFFYIMPWYIVFWRQVIEHHIQTLQSPPQNSNLDQFSLQELINFLPDTLKNQVATQMEKDPQEISLPQIPNPPQSIITILEDGDEVIDLNQDDDDDEEE